MKDFSQTSVKVRKSILPNLKIDGGKVERLLILQGFSPFCSYFQGLFEMNMQDDINDS